MARAQGGAQAPACRPRRATATGAVRRQGAEEPGQGEGSQEGQEEEVSAGASLADRSSAPVDKLTPRVLEFLTVKRNVALAGRSYGHWWIEIDGIESYGWWPGSKRLRTKDLLLGVTGVLNGMRSADGASPPRDPNHGLSADYEFHPVLMVSSTDDEVRQAIRGFAQRLRGDWRWSIRPTMNCRLFQLAMFDAVGLVDGSGNYRTRGSGCPVLAPIRRMATRFTGRRYWPANLPAPGRRVSGVGRRRGAHGSGCGPAWPAAASNSAIVDSTEERSGPGGARRVNWRSSTSAPALSFLPRKRTMPRKKWASA